MFAKDCGNFFVTQGEKDNFTQGEIGPTWDQIDIEKLKKLDF